MTEVSIRRVRESLLDVIRQNHGEEAYRKAKELYDEMARLDKEIEVRQKKIKSYNKILNDMVLHRTVPFDSIPEDEVAEGRGDEEDG